MNEAIGARSVHEGRHLLVVDDDGYVFRHALLREVAHEDMLPGRHTRLHARLAALLEERGARRVSICTLLDKPDVRALAKALNDDIRTAIAQGILAYLD